jgi:hypothetical protein
MSRRLHGLAILITGLAPIVLVVVVALATWVSVASVRSAVDDYSTKVSAEVGKATQVFTDVGAALDGVGVFMNGIATDVSTAVNDLGPISPDVRLPVQPVVIGGITLGTEPFTVDLPRITVLQAGALDFTIPGVEPLGQFIVDLGDSADAITGDIEQQLAGMIQLPAPIQAIKTSTEELGTSVGTTVRNWLIVVGVTLLVILAAFVTTRIGSAIEDVRRGWAMLMGREPVVSVQDLRAQLAAIERALAQLA